MELLSSIFPPPALPPPGTRHLLSSLVQQRGATRFDGGRTSTDCTAQGENAALSRAIFICMQPAEGFRT